MIDKLTLFFVYLMIAVMWNLLAGYAGLVSVGQQAFIGLRRLCAWCGWSMPVCRRLPRSSPEPPWPALVGLGAVVVRAADESGEFAIATWVIWPRPSASFVSFDPLVQGETGTSLDGAERL